MILSKVANCESFFGKDRRVNKSLIWQPNLIVKRAVLGSDTKADKSALQISILFQSSTKKEFFLARFRHPDNSLKWRTFKMTFIMRSTFIKLISKIGDFGKNHRLCRLFNKEMICDNNVSAIQRRNFIFHLFLMLYCKIFPLLHNLYVWRTVVLNTAFPCNDTKEDIQSKAPHYGFRCGIFLQ